MTRVIVAGAGVAAVECMLALRDLAGSRVRIELLAPAAELVHRPSSVATPFGADAPARIDVRGLGPRQHREALAAVDAEAHEVLTRGGERLAFDALVVATGAPSRDAVAGAVTFRGTAGAGAVERVVARAAADPRMRIAFVAPLGVTWPLPLYELALLSSAALRARGVDEPDVLVVTGEDEPLALLGAPAVEAVRAELDRYGVDVITGASAAFAIDGALKLHDGRLIRADAVIALPELVGPRVAGLPQDDARASFPSTRMAACRASRTSTPPATRPQSRSSTAASPPSRPTPWPRRSPSASGPSQPRLRSTPSCAECC